MSRLLLILLFLVGPVAAESHLWAIAIHGGAGANPARMTEAQQKASLEVLERALTVGCDILKRGGNALDCVEQVVRVLEDAPEFNAGKGAVFNSEGKHELDASIMDGRDRSCGAVAGVRTVKNPVSLARQVKEETRHVLLAGDGAEAFAKERGVDQVPNNYFSTERRRKQWEERRSYSKGTVGCVALDSKGNLAAATSTGGLTDKKWGRVGDSPVIGAGCYADNRSCAVSCTGTGEEFIRRAIGHDVSARMLYGEKTAPEAAEGALESLPENCGGLIVVGADGSVTAIFNTPGMARGGADSSGLFFTALGR